MTLIVNRINATHLRQILPALPVRLNTLSVCWINLRASWCLCHLPSSVGKKPYLNAMLFTVLPCVQAMRVRNYLFFMCFILGTIFAMILYVLWFCTGNDKRFVYQSLPGEIAMKMTGFDKLQKELKDAQRALSDLDGELGVINFDPDDPASIESAINQVNQVIDQRVGRYASNSIVGPLIRQMKEKYREIILQKAAEARLQSEGDE